ncbi:hypothetical protein [Cryptosporangium aurantiacum]|uniref:Uncharacterized protein n=1 Tax=Cryptosporangium aurantiacum TaxID=134849 RepID=A0A1M7RBP1_9ACTN|nr:hypothetical protein [Cryptosporangium aurantiacum]SHN43590.1 hypothetical protein SAMN05443668_109249 [Cryptosporangium aurantiacum]
MAELSTIAAAAVVVTIIAVAGFVATGVYRARYAATRDGGYRVLAERSADSAEAAAAELKGVRDELSQVRERLAALEKLLSQIG